VAKGEVVHWHTGTTGTYLVFGGVPHQIAISEHVRLRQNLGNIRRNVTSPETAWWWSLLQKLRW